MSLILNYFLPSIYGSRQIHRNPPNTVEEAANQASSLVRSFETSCKATHPWLFTFTASATQLNNKIVNVLSDSRAQTVEKIVLVLLPSLTFYSTPGSFYDKTLYSVASGVLYSSGLHLLKKLKTRLPALGAHKQELEHLIKETRELPDLNLVSLVEASLASSGIKKAFISYLIDDVSASVAKRPLSKRFIYEIAWKGEVTGYLIGTMHKVNLPMANDLILHETVKKCGCLILETHPKAVQLSGRVQKWIAPSHARYMLDAELLETALQNNIPAEGLASWNQHKKLNQYIKDHIYQTSDDNQIARAKHPEQHRLFELLDAYQRGDSQEWALQMQCQSPESYDVLLTSRNNTWLRGEPNLIKRLRRDPVLPPTNVSKLTDVVMISNPVTGEISIRSRKTTKPICIAVGVGHCVGKETGLVWQLRREGFEVTKKEQGTQN